MRQDPYLLGGGTPSKASSLIYTGPGDSGPSVCTDPSTLLLFATLQAISHSRQPKSLGPAEGICIRRTLGFWRRSREHRWQPCNRPPGPTCTIFGSLRNPQFSSWRPGEPKIRSLGSRSNKLGSRTKWIFAVSMRQDSYLLGGGTPSEASSLIYTGRGDWGPSVSRDPSTLLLFAALQAISHSARPKSLGPADTFRMWRTLGF